MDHQNKKEKYEDHSDADEQELDVVQTDPVETDIKRQGDSVQKDCQKTGLLVSSSIKRPQIAPKKPAIMERIEKEGWGDGAFESKESSSSGELSLSVSADEKTDNEDPGRIGDKIVQKVFKKFIYD